VENGNVLIKSAMQKYTSMNVTEILKYDIVHKNHEKQSINVLKKNIYFQINSKENLAISQKVLSKL